MSLDVSRQTEAGWRILVVGTGGQGVLTVARLLCETFAERGHDVVSGQLHGMAQRGGAVQSSVIIDAGISPVIASGRADCVLGFEPVETARALPYMSRRTVVYMNVTPVIPYILGQRHVLKEDQADYPSVKELEDSIRGVTSQVCAFDATGMALKAGSVTTLNMVMLGCLLGSGMLPCSEDDFWVFASGRIPPALADKNARAFRNGVALGRESRFAVRAP